MSTSPIRYVDQIAAFFGSFQSLFARIAFLFFCGGMGNLLAHLSSSYISSLDVRLMVAGFFAYPLILFLNLYETFGIAVTLLAIILLVGNTVFDVDPVHAFGLLIPFQALATLTTMHMGEGSLLWTTLFLLPFVGIYIAILWRIYGTST